MYAELCAQAFMSVFKVFMLSYSQPDCSFLQEDRKKWRTPGLHLHSRFRQMHLKS